MAVQEAGAEVIPDLLAPPGFRIVQHGRVALLASADVLEGLSRIGLDRAEGWQALLRDHRPRSGRGATARVELESGWARLKQLRRGGWARWIWKDRFPGTARALGNLWIPLEAARRNVPTPRPLALLLLEGPPRLFRAWLATQEIGGAPNLGEHFASQDSPERDDLAQVMAIVRQAHEAGVDHRDLNLGNILLRREPSRGPEVFVVDLDGARILAGPLSFRRRAQALFRLERSYVKRFGARGPRQELHRRLFYELYAAADPLLAPRVQRARRVGGLRTFLHRWGGLR